MKPKFPRKILGVLNHHVFTISPALFGLSSWATSNIILQLKKKTGAELACLFDIGWFEFHEAIRFPQYEKIFQINADHRYILKDHLT